MTKKLFDVTQNDHEELIRSAMASVAPAAHSPQPATTPGKVTEGTCVAVDIETYNNTDNQHGLNVQSFVADVLAVAREDKFPTLERKELVETLCIVAQPSVSRQLGKSLSVSEKVRQAIEVDSLAMAVDESRTVDEIPGKKPLKGHLTVKPSKVRFVLEDTKIGPSGVVMMSGKLFKEAYKKQLTNLIFNGHDPLNTEQLISLTRVYDAVRKTPGGVQVSSQRFKRKLPDVLDVLNKFFTSQHFILSSIVDMVSSSVTEEVKTSFQEISKADVEIINPKIKMSGFSGKFGSPNHTLYGNTKDVPLNVDKIPPADDIFEYD